MMYSARVLSSFVFICGVCAAWAKSCDEKDSICWSILATKLTNQVRQRHGVQGTLIPGPKSMLDNALKHSEWMMGSGNFEHQDLATVTSEIRCGVFCSYVELFETRP